MAMAGGVGRIRAHELSPLTVREALKVIARRSLTS